MGQRKKHGRWGSRHLHVETRASGESVRHFTVATALLSVVGRVPKNRERLSKRILPCSCATASKFKFRQRCARGVRVVRVTSTLLCAYFIHTHTLLSHHTRSMHHSITIIEPRDPRDDAAFGWWCSHTHTHSHPNTTQMPKVVWWWFIYCSARRVCALPCSTGALSSQSKISSKNANKNCTRWRWRGLR